MVKGFTALGSNHVKLWGNRLKQMKGLNEPWGAARTVGFEVAVKILKLRKGLEAGLEGLYL